MSLSVFHTPASVAIIGASNDSEKIGGRPIRYLKELGFAGAIYPVNPTRDEVQGVRSYPSLDDLPGVPEVAIIAVSGRNAVDAVVRCAALGVQGCIIMASGFGETGGEEELGWQREILEAAHSSGMRIVGPNSQGLANFESGAVLSFSTLFTEQAPLDGPVAIVSQSGAMASVPYGLLREAGIGVRYAHGTGNDIDVSAAELAAEVLEDPGVELLLLYLEDLSDLDSLALVGRRALERSVPVILLKGGRSKAGQRAAASHTGALATEDVVVDAFLEQHGIWRARSTRDLVSAVRLYLRPTTPRGGGLAIVSNSGAVCVLAADAASDNGIPLAELSDTSKAELAAALPAFASVLNPIDVTAALLTDSSLFGKVLPVLGRDPAVGACALGIPVAGKGYDVPRFARDVAEFEATSDVPLVMVVPQSYIASVFREQGTAVFGDETEALRALGQYLRHGELIAAAKSRSRRDDYSPPAPETGRRALNESDSLAALDRYGIPVVEHVVIDTPEAAGVAMKSLGGGPVVIKGCSAHVTHKSELGLVRVGVRDEGDATQVAAEMFTIMAREGIPDDGVIIARMMRGVREGMLGGRIDPVFGPVVLLGAGGVHVEALPDVQLLLPPFSADDAERAIRRLRIAALLDGVRGEPAVDVGAWATAAVALGDALLRGDLLEVDVNPLMLLDRDGDVQPAIRAVDAVVIVADDPAHDWKEGL